MFNVLNSCYPVFVPTQALHPAAWTFLMSSYWCCGLPPRPVCTMCALKLSSFFTPKFHMTDSQRKMTKVGSIDKTITVGAICMLTAVSGRVLKNTGEGKSSQWAELQAGAHASLLCLKGEIARCVYELVMGWSQWLGCMVRNLERTWLQSWWEGNLWKTFVDRVLREGKELWMYV